MKLGITVSQVEGLERVMRISSLYSSFPILVFVCTTGCPHKNVGDTDTVGSTENSTISSQPGSEQGSSESTDADKKSTSTKSDENGSSGCKARTIEFRDVNSEIVKGVSIQWIQSIFLGERHVSFVSFEADSNEEVELPFSVRPNLEETKGNLSLSYDGGYALYEQLEGDDEGKTPDENELDANGRCRFYLEVPISVVFKTNNGAFNEKLRGQFVIRKKKFGDLNRDELRGRIFLPRITHDTIMGELVLSEPKIKKDQKLDHWFLDIVLVLTLSGIEKGAIRIHWVVANPVEGEWEKNDDILPRYFYIRDNE